MDEMLTATVFAPLCLLFLIAAPMEARQVQTLSSPELVAPAEGATVLQNVESSYCRNMSPAGFGYSIQFGWSPVEGAKQYELVVQRTGASSPMLDRLTAQLSYEEQHCAAFITVSNLSGWTWRVRAVPEAGDPGPWSAPRHFAFEPCRLEDGTPCRAPATPDSATPSGQPDANGVYRIGGDVTPPTLVAKVEPQYSEEARKACVNGTILLSVIVDNQGQPRDIHVVRPLGMGLDEKAIAAVSQWHFNPGMKNGQPVAVRAQIEVNFRIVCKKT
jgi:TonB family protein